MLGCLPGSSPPPKSSDNQRVRPRPAHLAGVRFSGVGADEVKLHK